MASLFDRLTSYTPSHVRNPREDMLTDPEVARRIADEWILGRMGLGTSRAARAQSPARVSEQLHVQTQRRLRTGDRIDLELRFGRRARPAVLIWVEAKLCARLSGETQLIDYARALSAEPADERLLVLLAPFGYELPPEAPAPESVVHTDWRRVARIIRGRAREHVAQPIIGSESYASRVVRDFLAHLDQRRLAMSEALTLKDALAIAEYEAAAATIGSIWQEADEQIHRKVTNADAGATDTPKPRPRNLDFWRIYAPSTPSLGEGSFLEWNLRGRPPELGGRITFGAGLSPTAALLDQLDADRLTRNHFERFNDGRERLFRILPIAHLLSEERIEDQVQMVVRFVLEAFVAVLGPDSALASHVNA
jgi:hypothetical protein